MIELASIKVELGDVKPYRCECCGNYSETVHGYLWDRTGETAVYFARYTDGHPDRQMKFLVSIGGWGEDTPVNRHAIPMIVRAQRASSQVEYEFVEPKTSPWYGTELVGEMKERDALSNDERSLAVELAKKALALDPRIVAYVASGEFQRPSEN